MINFLGYFCLISRITGVKSESDNNREIWVGESDKSIINLVHSEKAIQITGPDKVIITAKEIVLKGDQKITLDAPEIKATHKIDQPNISAQG